MEKMKTTYITPNSKVIMMMSAGALLAGSPDLKEDGTSVDAGDARSRFFIDNWDEDEE